MQPELTTMHDRYVWQVNNAVTQDRLDLIDELNEQYIEEALQLILATA